LFLFVSNITGSEIKQKSQNIYRTNDVIGALLRVSLTSPDQFKPGRSWVICLLDNWLFCQNTVTIYSILPMLLQNFLSTVAQKLCHRS